MIRKVSHLVQVEEVQVEEAINAEFSLIYGQLLAHTQLSGVLDVDMVLAEARLLAAVQKGQKARTGGKIHRAFSGGQTRLSKRLPFVRGLGNSNTAFRDEYTILNVVDLGTFEADAQVNPEVLVANGLMTRAEGRGLIKVLGNGEIDCALHVKAHKFSASARAKIEAAGGSVKIIPVKVYEKTKRRKDEKAGKQ